MERPSTTTLVNVDLDRLSTSETYGALEIFSTVETVHISNFSDVPTISLKCSHLIVTGLGRPGLPPCWNDIASTAIGSATKIFKISTFKFSYYLQSPNTILIFEIPFFQNFDIKKKHLQDQGQESPPSSGVAGLQGSEHEAHVTVR